MQQSKVICYLLNTQSLPMVCVCVCVIIQTKQHYYPQVSSLHAAACVCVRSCAHLAPAGVQVVAVRGEEQMGEASVVAGRQQSQQGAVLAGVEASAAGVRATGVNRLAGAEAKAGDDATLALLLHCSEDMRVAFGKALSLLKGSQDSQLPSLLLKVDFLAAHAFLITSPRGKYFSITHTSSVSFYSLLFSQSSFFSLFTKGL